MKRTPLHLPFLICVICVICGSKSETLGAATPPNFLLVLCDDLGYGDLACYPNDDSTLHTPNVDAFAAEGLRLTDCYAAAANCSPARTGLMTGRTPWRVGIHNWIPFHSPMHVSRDETTIATLLRSAGYDTLHSGKWHLNGDLTSKDFPQPSDHGFNHWFSAQNNALPNHRNPVNFVRNGKPVGPLEGYSADLVTFEAIQWLTDLRDKTKPFFAFICYQEPHEPIATAPEHAERYREYSKGNESFMAHHGNITQMDAAFGRLMKTIDDLDLRDDTLVFFTSDNGPAITGHHPHGSSGPLRDKKGTMYEGGIRVPGILRWPGHTRPGTTSSTPVCGVDVLPTFCAIAGIDLPTAKPLDGTSILPILENKPIARSTPLYWHFYRAKGKAKIAMRDGPWKILAGLDAPEPRPGADITAEENEINKTATLTGFELYNLEDDIGEQNDLANTQSERLAALRAKLEEKYLEVRAESPTWPEWEWPHYESQRIEWPTYKGKALDTP